MSKSWYGDNFNCKCLTLLKTLLVNCSNFEPLKGKKAVKCILSEGQFEIHKNLGFYYFMKAFKSTPCSDCLLAVK